MVMDINFDEIVDWVKKNGLPNDFVCKLKEANEIYSNSLSKELRYKELCTNIKLLNNLYNSNQYFINWCNWLKKIVLYDEYIQSCEENYIEAQSCEDEDENFYIPCITGKWWSSDCNPYLKQFIDNKIIFISHEFDFLVMNSEAFSCFWKNKINTKLIPTFIESDSSYSYYEQIDSEKYSKYYTRILTYNSYNNSELKKLWEDALNVQE